MSNKSWPLNGQHRVHYFSETPDASKLFRRISRWLKENPVEVVAVAVEHRFDEETAEDIVYYATLVYLR